MDGLIGVILLIILGIAGAAGAIWYIVNPEEARDFVIRHPSTDRTGDFKNFSDIEIRISGVFLLLFDILLVGGFIFTLIEQ